MRPRKKRWQPKPNPHRRGSLLVVVLVALSLLSLAAWTFSEAMIGEYKNTRRQAEVTQARMAAESGVQVVAALLQDPGKFSAESVYDNELFRGQVVREFENGSKLRFSIVSPLEYTNDYASVRNGLIDESGKLNINLLARIKNTGTARSFLMWIPNMTEDLADAILDWIDEDEKKREYGAELEEYSLEDVPREPANRALKSLDELLQVLGMTPDLLYGEDANRNGLLDPNERDGDQNLPWDDGDNYLDRGFSQFLTVHSRESNLRIDGTLKINVNSDDLALLYDTIELEIGEEEAKFIVAYRLYGPQPTPADLQAGISGGVRVGQDPFNQPGQTQQGGMGGGMGGGAGGEEPTEAILRGGMDVSQQPRARINSLFDLVGSAVQARIDDQQQTLQSPWPADLDEFQQYGPLLFETFTNEKGRSFQGRLNLNNAPLELIAGLPGMSGLDDERLEIIETEQLAAMEGTFGGEEIGGNFSDNILVRLLVNYPDDFDLALMKSWGPFVSNGGRVFRFQVVGHFTDKNTFCRIEAIVDGSQIPAKVIFQRDLTDHGIGYQRSDLGLE